MKIFYYCIALIGLGLSVQSNIHLNAMNDNRTTEMPETATSGNDYRIIKDSLADDGIRYISAVPSSKVCSKRIDIELSGDIVNKVTYFRGCSGNTQGVGALIKGMSVQEAVSRLSGINCNGKGTSCPDQLAKILRSVSENKSED